MPAVGKTLQQRLGSSNEEELAAALAMLSAMPHVALSHHSRLATLASSHQCSFHVRLRALQALSVITEPTQEIVPHVAACLEDDDDRLKCAALECLPRIGPDALALATSVSRLLGNGNNRVREAAKKALLHWGEAAVSYAAPTLSVLLANAKAQPTLLPDVAIVLSHMGEAWARHVIASTLKLIQRPEETELARIASRVVAQLSPLAVAFASHALLLLIRQPVSSSTAALTLTIDTIGTLQLKDQPHAYSYIEPHLLSRDGTVRAAAVEALARLCPGGGWVEEARLMAVDNDALVRAAATNAIDWKTIDARESQAAFARLLADRDAAVRSSAATAVGRLGPSAQQWAGPVSRLVQTGACDVRGHTSPAVRVAPAQALALLGVTDDSVISLIAQQLFIERDATALRSLVVALQTLDKDARHCDKVAKLLQESSNLAVQHACVDALGSYGDRASDYTQSVWEALIRNSPSDPVFLSRAVVRLKSAAALAKSGPATLQKSAVTALRNMRAVRLAAPLLQRMQTETDSSLQWSIAAAVADLACGCPSTVQLLLQSLITTSHPDLCCCATFILSQFDSAYIRLAKCALKEQLEQDDTVRQLNAIDSLAIIGTRADEYAKPISAFLAHPESDLVGAYAELLISLVYACRIGSHRCRCYRPCSTRGHATVSHDPTSVEPRKWLNQIHGSALDRAFCAVSTCYPVPRVVRDTRGPPHKCRARSAGRVG
jgi:hypothetical protein